MPSRTSIREQRAHQLQLTHAWLSSLLLLATPGGCGPALEPGSRGSFETGAVVDVPPHAPAPSGDDGGVSARSPRCVATSCPMPATAALPLDLWYAGTEIAELVQQPCCIGAQTAYPDLAAYAGECGVQMVSTLGPRCEPIVAGKPDPSCLDTVVRGERVAGCRRSDGRCGHASAGWGCHLMYRLSWYWGSPVGQADPGVANPFNCTRWGEPCSHSVDCCAPPSYGGGCYNMALQADAGAADAGPRLGSCGNPELGYTLID